MQPRPAPEARILVHGSNNQGFVPLTPTFPASADRSRGAHPNRSGAGSVRAERRNVDILLPLARQRDRPAGPNVPRERGLVPRSPPNNRSGAGSVRAERRNVDILFPLARQRERPAGPNVPRERGPIPRSPTANPPR